MALYYCSVNALQQKFALFSPKQFIGKTQTPCVTVKVAVPTYVSGQKEDQIPPFKFFGHAFSKKKQSEVQSTFCGHCKKETIHNYFHFVLYYGCEPYLFQYINQGTIHAKSSTSYKFEF